MMRRTVAVAVATHLPAATATGSSASVAPLPVMPTFAPRRFAQDRFLSIKSRSAETFIESRRDILNRSAKLRERVEALAASSHGHAREGEGDSGQADGQRPPLFLDRLPPSLVEEMDNIHKKIDRLESMQGFVLTDELVYRAFHESVANGHYRAALHAWLLPRILGEGRGPVFPSFLLDDLRAVVDSYLLPVLPDAQAEVTMQSRLPPPPPPAAAAPPHAVREAANRQARTSWALALLDSGGGTGASPIATTTTTTTAAATAPLLREPSWEEKREFVETVLTEFPSPSQVLSVSAGAAAAWNRRSGASSSSRYVRHQLSEYGLPLLAAADALGLLFTEAEPEALEELDDDNHEGTERGGAGGGEQSGDGLSLWLPRPEVQRAAVAALLRRFTRHHSFLVSPPHTGDSPRAQTEATAAAVSLESFDMAAKKAEGRAERRAGESDEGSDGFVTVVGLTRLYLSLAQCAAETRSDILLLSLFAAFLRGFVTREAGTRRPCLNTALWVSELSSPSSASSWSATNCEERGGRVEEEGEESAAVTVLLEQFAVEFLSTLFYGRQGVLADRTLWQAQDVMQVMEAVRIALSEREGTEAPPSAATERESALREPVMQESVLSSVRALMSSASFAAKHRSSTTSHDDNEGGHADYADDSGTSDMRRRALSEGLPSLLRRILRSPDGANGPHQHQHFLVADAVWGELASLANELLDGLGSSSSPSLSSSGSPPPPPSSPSDLQKQVRSAKLYVAVADGDVAALEQHRQDVAAGVASPPLFTEAELAVMAAAGVAGRRARQEGRALLSLLSCEQASDSNEVQGSELPRETEVAGLEAETVRSLLARTAALGEDEGDEGPCQVADGLLDVVTANALARSLAFLRQCYQAAVSSSTLASGGQPHLSLGNQSNAGGPVQDGSDGSGEDMGGNDAILAEDAHAEHAGSEKDEEDGAPSAAATAVLTAAGVDSFRKMLLSGSASVTDAVRRDAHCLHALCGAFLVPAAAARLAVLYNATTAANSPSATHASPHASSSLEFYTALTESVIARATGAAGDGASSSPLFGNALGVLLLCLARAGHWSLVGSLLTSALFPHSHNRRPHDASPTAQQQQPSGQTTQEEGLLSSVTVEPEVFAEVFQRAREDGASEVCLLLRQHRERLFF